MRVAYFFNNLFLLYPWVEKALALSLFLGAALFVIQRLTSSGDARAFWSGVGKHPLTWVFLGFSLMGAYSVPVPGSYYLNCGGTSDAPELQAAMTNNASGRFNVMYVPNGVCLIGSTITVTQANSGLTILGVSANNSIIRQAPGANLSGMFSGANTAGNTLKNFTVQNLTLDENYANNTSATSGTIFQFGGGGNYTNHLFNNANLINCTKSCITYQTTGTVSNITVRDNVFNGSQCAGIIAYDAIYVLITGNTFETYDAGGSTSFCAAIVAPESNGTANSNWTVSNNIAYPNGSVEFFFETDPQTGVTPTSMQVIHNNCNALGGNGCGVSMVGDHSIVGYNTVINAAYGDRSGCECGGSDFMIIGNNYYNGQISISNNSNAYPVAYFNGTASASTSLTVNSTSYGTVTAGQFVFGPGFPVGTYIISYSGGVATLNNAVTVTAQNLTAGGPNGILVLDNIIGLHGAPTSNGVSAIQAAGVNHLEIRNNLITINFTNTTNSYPAIYMGFYGGAGPVNYAVVEGNHIIDLSPTSSMIGIKVNDSSTTPDNYVAVRRNTIEGFQTGLFFDSSAYSTYINACSNDLRTTTTAISGAPTGTGSSVANSVCTVSF